MHELNPEGLGRHVLIVDDDPSIRRALHRQLSRNGYRVSLAEHGEEALCVLNEYTDVSVVLSDLVMPVMGGEGLVAAIAASNNPIPCVVMTGHTSENLALPHVLSKPFAADDLLVKLRSVLEK